MPAWLGGPNGLAYALALGTLKDQLATRAGYGAQVGLPLVAPPDALPAINFERQIGRGPGTTDAQYAAALADAWNAWPKAGTPLGILLAIEILYPGVPVYLIQQASFAFTLDIDKTLDPYARLKIITLPAGGWKFDNNGGLPYNQGFWNRFGILFPGPWPASWTSPASPPTSMSAPTLNEVNSLIGVVNKWRNGDAAFQWIKLIPSGVRVWGWPQGGQWGQGNWGAGGSVITWQSTPY